MSEIGYKDLKVLRNILAVAWHPILIALFLWMCVRYSKGKILLTDAYRKGDKGVHGTDPLRGFDLRSSVFDNPELVAEDVNSVWIYDPDRPHMKCCILHDVGKGIHLHFQVHPKTIYKGEIK